jgi:hypothetical protein
MAMYSGNRNRLTQTEGVKLHRRHLPLQILALVGYQRNRLAATPQSLGNLLIGSATPIFRIQQKQDMVGLIYSGLNLLVHQQINSISFATNAAGINHQIAPAAESADTVLTITGQTRLIGYQRIPATGEPVEQGRFTYIGAPHKGDNRKHKIGSYGYGSTVTASHTG